MVKEQVGFACPNCHVLWSGLHDRSVLFTCGECGRVLYKPETVKEVSGESMFGHHYAAEVTRLKKDRDRWQQGYSDQQHNTIVREEALLKQIHEGNKQWKELQTVVKHLADAGEMMYNMVQESVLTNEELLEVTSNIDFIRKYVEE